MKKLNSLLHFSQEHKNTKINNWKGIEGTFTVVLYQTLQDEGFTKPEYIKLKYNRKLGKLTVYKVSGKSKTFTRSSWSAVLMTEKIKGYLIK